MTCHQYELYLRLHRSGKIGRVWLEGGMVRVGLTNEMERVLGPSAYASSDLMSEDKFSALLYNLADIPDRIPPTRELDPHQMRINKWNRRLYGK